jgi:hypothetical protein
VRKHLNRAASVQPSARFRSVLPISNGAPSGWEEHGEK